MWGRVLKLMLPVLTASYQKAKNIIAVINNDVVLLVPDHIEILHSRAPHIPVLISLERYIHSFHKDIGNISTSLHIVAFSLTIMDKLLHN